MANNIFIGNQFVVANANSDMSLFNTTNTAKVYGTLNGNFVSFTPGSGLNSLTSLVAGKGYQVVSKVAREMPIFVPAQPGIATLS